MTKKASKSNQKGGQTSSSVGSVTGPANDAYDFYDPSEIRPEDLSSPASGGRKGNQSGSGKKSVREPTDPNSQDAYGDYNPTEKRR